MGGMMILGTAAAGASILGGIGAARDQEKAYEAEAKMAEMQAEQDEIGRRRALNDALAMQAVMFAGQGRAPGEGSPQQIIETDTSRAERDIDIIKQGGKSKAMGLRATGRITKMAGYTKALSSAGQSAYSMGQVK